MHRESGAWVRPSFRRASGFLYFRLLFECVVPYWLLGQESLVADCLPTQSRLLTTAKVILEQLLSGGQLAECMKDVTLQYNKLVEVPLMKWIIDNATGTLVPGFSQVAKEVIEKWRSRAGSWGDRFEMLGYARDMR